MTEINQPKKTSNAVNFVKNIGNTTANNHVNATVNNESIFAQNAKSFGKNFVAWTKDQDKVCTDNNDDGKIGNKEALKSFGKGLACLAKLPFQFAYSVKNAAEVTSF